MWFINFLCSMFGLVKKEELANKEVELSTTKATLATKEVEVEALKEEKDVVVKENEVLTAINNEVKVELEEVHKEEELSNADNYYMLKIADKICIPGTNVINSEKGSYVYQDASFRTIYNDAWALDPDKKVTIEEFNEHFTYYYQRRFNRETVDDYTFWQLVHTKTMCMLTIDAARKAEYGYNSKKELIYVKDGSKVIKDFEG